MKKLTLYLIFIFSTLNLYSQSIESITKRVTKEICECVGKTKSESKLRKKLKKCSDKKINFIMNNSTKAENKVLLKGNNLQTVISKVKVSVLSNCENVKRFSKNSNAKSFPTNFGITELKGAINNPKKHDGKIISFNAEILRVEKSNKNTPYYKVKIESKTFWVFSMINSGFEKIGNKVKILGYFMLIDKKHNEFERKFHQDEFQVLSFAIIDLKTKKMTHFPGSENQIKEWKKGEIPSNGKE